jgi:hypothetical protein
MSHRYYDDTGFLLARGDYVYLRTRLDELFQIKAFQYPCDAIIENVIPGNRIATSTLPCRDLTRAINNLPDEAPDWFDTTYGEEPDLSPMRGTLLPCGCHLRRVDYEAVLCEQHLIEVNS